MKSLPVKDWYFARCRAKKEQARKLSTSALEQRIEQLESRRVRAVTIGFSGGILSLNNSDNSAVSVDVEFDTSTHLFEVNGSDVSGANTSTLKEITFNNTGSGTNTVKVNWNDDTHFSNVNVVLKVQGSGINNFLGVGEYVGASTIQGGTGHDTLEAYNKSAVINGNGGNDYVYVEYGHDTITTGSGDDSIYAYSGNYKISAGEGNNYVEVEYANANITTGNGNNSVFLESGTFTVTTGNGADTLGTEYGANTVANLGGGDDSVYMYYGGTMNVNLGSGNDSFYDDYGGKVTIAAGSGDDSIDFEEGGKAVVDLGNGDDTYYTYEGGKATVTGGDGNDYIYGEYYGTLNYAARNWERYRLSGIRRQPQDDLLRRIRQCLLLQRWRPELHRRQWKRYGVCRIQWRYQGGDRQWHGQPVCLLYRRCLLRDRHGCGYRLHR
ncbi:MAG: calcium-binding protein [Chthoniobacteraceae bacterium]